MTIDENEAIEIADKRLADEMRRHERIEVKESEPAEVEVPEIKAPNLMPYKIQELRSIAAGKGIEGSIGMKKSELIRRLEWIL